MVLCVNLDLYLHLDDSMEDYIEMVLEVMAAYESEELAGDGVGDYSRNTSSNSSS
jgi:hypothetical protein